MQETICTAQVERNLFFRIQITSFLLFYYVRCVNQYFSNNVFLKKEETQIRNKKTQE